MIPFGPKKFAFFTTFVIGGIAGARVSNPLALRVLVITKDQVESNSNYTQGALQCAARSIQNHIEDTDGGGGLCDREVVDLGFAAEPNVP